MPDKPALALAFVLGVGGGATTAELVSADPYTVRVEAVPQPPRALKPEAAARFAPLTSDDVTEIEVIFRGAPSEEDPSVFFPVTFATYRVPSVRGGRGLQGEHRSLTNSDALPGIVQLVEQVIVPAAKAQCPDLDDAEAYPALSLAHVESAGVDRRDARYPMAVARISVQPKDPESGLPTENCRVRVPAPEDAVRVVEQMVAGYVVPAIKAERGLL